MARRIFTRLNAAPRKIPRRAPRAKRASRSGYERTPPVLYWVAALLVTVLVALGLVGWQMPQIKAYLAARENAQPPLPSESLAQEPEPSKPPPAPPTEEEKQAKRLQEKVEMERQQLVERPAPAPVPPPPVPVASAPLVEKPVVPPEPSVAPKLATDAAPNEALPPVAQPLIDSRLTGKSTAPVRALPLDLTKLDAERIAAYQVALERIHFSCGFIDGNQGMRTQRMLRAFQTSRGLPVTGFLDQPTRDAIGEPGEPFLNYIITDADLASIMPKPAGWREKSQATRLGYNDMWEMLGEKFHCTRAYLKALNPGVKDFVAGTEVIGPKVFPTAPIPKAASLRIFLSETYIEAIDASGQIVGFFPCSIAKDKAKRPNGELTVKSVVPNPDYTFDPALFADAAKAEGLTKKMVLPPGPRNPVGTTWIGLSLPGYGIHGTPEPENISRTQSHGCFRLANWNAEKVLKMVKIGTPVDVQP